MIEELKFLLEAMGNVDNIALYVLGGFGVYKLIVYLSGVGAAVMLSKLLIVKLHDVFTREKVVTKRVQLGNVFINEEDWKDVEDLIKSYRDATYIHNRQAENIKNALRKGLAEKDKA